MGAFFDVDTIIALGLVGIVIVTFLIYRMGLLPKKSLPFVVGGLLAVFGIYMFRSAKRNGLKKELEKREKELREEEKKLAEMKANLNVSEEELAQAQVELDNQRAAVKKAMLLNEAENKAEKERIDNLSTEETFDEFDQVFGG